MDSIVASTPPVQTDGKLVTLLPEQGYRPGIPEPAPVQTLGTDQQLALCRHCRQKPANRPRGLCWTCYYTPGVTEHYPSTSKYGRVGTGSRVGTRPVPRPPEPTMALPGSPEKVEVLCQRASRHQCLWHPADEYNRYGYLDVPLCAVGEQPDGRSRRCQGRQGRPHRRSFSSGDAVGVVRSGNSWLARYFAGSRQVYVGRFPDKDKAVAAVRRAKAAAGLEAPAIPA